MTSHLDIAPSLVSWTDADAKTQSKITNDLNGHDLTPLPATPGEAKVNTLREASSYCFEMWMVLDGDFIGKISKYLKAGNDPKKIN